MGSSDGSYPGIFAGCTCKGGRRAGYSGKTKNYLGNKSQITIIPDVTYTTNLANKKLEANQTYTLKVSGSNIVVLKGSNEVGKASQVEAKPMKERSSFD